jgi:hypothetical protein
MTKTITLITVCVLLAVAGLAQAQTGTTTLSVTVGPEAALTVNTSTTTLSTASTTFGNPYTGTTNLTYQIRTSKVSGTGTLTLKITADFGGVGGPSVASSGTTGDTLTYTCTVTAPGTACTGTQTSSTTASTGFGTWGAAANSTKAGNAASVAWSLVDDPAYAPGTYTATATFTISAA